MGWATATPTPTPTIGWPSSICPRPCRGKCSGSRGPWAGKGACGNGCSSAGPASWPPRPKRPPMIAATCSAAARTTPCSTAGCSARPGRRGNGSIACASASGRTPPSGASTGCWCWRPSPCSGPSIRWRRPVRGGGAHHAERGGGRSPAGPAAAAGSAAAPAPAGGGTRRPRPASGAAGRHAPGGRTLRVDRGAPALAGLFSGAAAGLAGAAHDPGDPGSPGPPAVHPSPAGTGGQPARPPGQQHHGYRSGHVGGRGLAGTGVAGGRRRVGRSGAGGPGSPRLERATTLLGRGPRPSPQ